MRKKSATVLCAFLFSFVGTAGWAGTSTNGTGLAREQNNVWFLGPQAIEYCVDVAAGFNFGRETGKRLVRGAIDGWKSFFAKYQLDQMSFPELVDGRRVGLSLDFVEVERCENPREQLRFLFGVIDAEVREALEQEEGAVALASRKTFNHKSLRNGGFVYVRSAGLPEPEVKHLLLHELGHVFGMEHESVFAMQARTAELVVLLKMPRALLGRIESPNWHYRLDAGSVIDFTATDSSQGGFEPNRLLGVLNHLLGFSKAGTHSLRLTANSQPDLNTPWRTKLEFVERGGGKKATLEGVFSSRSSFFKGVLGTQGPSLYAAWKCERCGPGRGLTARRYLDMRPAPLEADGYFKKDGRILPAVLDHRSGAHLRIFVRGHGWWRSDDYPISYYLNN